MNKKEEKIQALESSKYKKINEINALNSTIPNLRKQADEKLKLIKSDKASTPTIGPNQINPFQRYQNEKQVEQISADLLIFVLYILYLGLRPYFMLFF